MWSLVSKIVQHQNCKKIYFLVVVGTSPALSRRRRQRAGLHSQPLNLGLQSRPHLLALQPRSGFPGAQPQFEQRGLQPELAILRSQPGAPAFLSCFKSPCASQLNCPKRLPRGSERGRSAPSLSSSSCIPTSSECRSRASSSQAPF